jgi:hypothetical protein
MRGFGGRERIIEIGIQQRLPDGVFRPSGPVKVAPWLNSKCSIFDR